MGPGGGLGREEEMKGGLGRYRGRLISTGGTHVHGGSEAREKKERGIILRNIYPLSLFAKSSLPLERERDRESLLPQPHLFLYLHSLSLRVPCSVSSSSSSSSPIGSDGSTTSYRHLQQFARASFCLLYDNYHRSLPSR